MSDSLPQLQGSERTSERPLGHGDGGLARGLRLFQETLHHGGLDLVQPFALGDLAEAKTEHPRFSSYRPTQLGLVVGNTRALWPAFQRHLRGLGVRSSDELGPDPLDIYVEELVHGALSELEDGCGIRSTAVFSHDLLPIPVPIQRVAEMAGLARIGPAHLSVHSKYGTWIALRAVVGLDAPAGLGSAIDAEPSDTHPCDGCDAPCRRALSGALLHRDRDVGRASMPPPPKGLSERQRRWLGVRDACPVGRIHRYSEGQILYHYDRQRDALFGDWKPRR